jgi:hypothetical protein
MIRIGTNWGGMDSPNYLDYLREHSMVVGTIDFPRDEIVLISTGQHIQAIGIVQEEGKPIADFEDHALALAKGYNVEILPDNKLAPVQWIDLPESEKPFRHGAQQGVCYVHETSVIEKALKFLKNSNIAFAERHLLEL